MDMHEYRGECQLCGGSWAINTHHGREGVTSDHGYKLKWEERQASCPGSHHQPYEKSRSLIADHIFFMEQTILGHDKAIQERMESGEAWVPGDGLRNGRPGRWERITLENMTQVNKDARRYEVNPQRLHDALMRTWQWNQDQRRKQMVEYRDWLQNRHDSWTLRDLRSTDAIRYEKDGKTEERRAAREAKKQAEREKRQVTPEQVQAAKDLAQTYFSLGIRKMSLQGYRSSKWVESVEEMDQVLSGWQLSKEGPLKLECGKCYHGAGTKTCKCRGRK